MDKKNEEKPSAIKEDSARVINALPDALIVLDLNGVVLSVNPAYTKLFGWKPEERVGKSFAEFRESLKSEDIEKFLSMMGKLIETGYTPPVETIIRAKDGREIPVSVTNSLLRDKEGNPEYIIAMLMDITELKRAEEKRIEAKKKAARAEEAEKYSKELEAKVKELEEFHDLAVGRELKMKKMEDEMEELKKTLEEQEK